MQDKKEKLKEILFEIKEAVKSKIDYFDLENIFDVENFISYTDDIFDVFDDKMELVRAFLYGDGIRAYNSEFVKFNAYGNFIAIDIDEELDSLVEEYISDENGLQILFDYLEENINYDENLFDIYIMIKEYFDLFYVDETDSPDEFE